MSPTSAVSEPNPIPWHHLAHPLLQLAESWHRNGFGVAARRDDANEWRIMKLRPNEEQPWIGWCLVFFHG